jgi:imidazolonepropionase-like amidohydrolase
VTETLAIVADRLIDGTEREPVERAVLVVSNGRVDAVGPRASVQIPAGATIVEGDDLTLLPGFIDAHVHLAGQSGVDFNRLLMTQRSMLLLMAVPNAAVTLEAGVTSVRDAGLSPASVRDAIAAGYFPGPRCHMAVSILSQSGGHGDPTMPCGCELYMDCGMDVPDARVDGPETMRRRVREVLAAGADWIKLCTSGGVLSPNDHPDAAQFTVAEIEVAVEEAATQGKRVMAHAISTAGIKNALRAGVTSIEHGCLLDEEAIAMMKERDAWLVPTLVAPRDVIDAGSQGRGIPEPMVAKARDISARHMESFRAAVAAGVNIAMGTDAAVGPHGGNLREPALMVEGGMTPLDAIRASTGAPARLLRRDAELGTLEAGKLADVVAVAGDPLADIRCLQDKRNIQIVMKEGKVYADRRPGHSKSVVNAEPGSWKIADYL